MAVSSGNPLIYERNLFPYGIHRLVSRNGIQSESWTIGNLFFTYQKRTTLLRYPYIIHNLFANKSFYVFSLMDDTKTSFFREKKKN